MDIAYDEIPERHYKESEVRGVRSLKQGHTFMNEYMHTSEVEEAGVKDVWR